MDTDTLTNSDQLESKLGLSVPIARNPSKADKNPSKLCAQFDE